MSLPPYGGKEVQLQQHRPCDSHSGWTEEWGPVTGVEVRYLKSTHFHRRGVSTLDERTVTGIQDQVKKYAAKYGRPNDYGYGFETYTAHLFSGEEGLGAGLDDHWEDDLSDLVLPNNDRGIDVVLKDETNKRLVLVQCKYSPRKPPDEDSLHRLVQAHDYLRDPEFMATASTALRDALGEYADAVADGWRVELRFATAASVTSDHALRRAAEAATRTFEKKGDEVRVVVLDRVDLSRAKRDLHNIDSGLVASVSIKVKGSMCFEIPAGASRHALVARISANELLNLYRQQGMALFAFNIRLPLAVGRPTSINERMRETAQSNDQAGDFFFFNNGVSAVCSKFTITDNTVTADRFQIINGAQTVDALNRATTVNDVYLLFRLTATDEPTGGEFTVSVIRYNNTQNPIADSDFRSNDPIQTFLHEQFGSRLSGQGALKARSFTYAPKRGMKTKGKSRRLRLEELAKLRHSFLYGPIVSYRNPKCLWELGNKYEEAFGEQGQFADTWSDEALCEAGCAYEIWQRVLETGADLKGKTDAQGNPVLEGRYLKRMSLYVVGLVGAGLREWHGQPEGFATWCGLVGSPSEFSRFVEPLIREARKTLGSAFQARLATKQEVQPEYNLARDDGAWVQARDGLVQQVASGLIVPG